MKFLCASSKCLSNFVLEILQISYKLIMNFLQTYCDHLTIFLWTSYRLIVTILQSSYELLTNFLWTYYQLIVTFLQTSYDKFVRHLDDALFYTHSCHFVQLFLYK
jgi:hypothetical protein